MSWGLVILDRPGGYSRIVRLSLRRLGDNGELVLLQLLGKDEPVKKERKTSSKKRSRRKAKAAAKPAQAEAKTPEQPAEAVAEAPQEPRQEAAGEPEKESK